MYQALIKELLSGHGLFVGMSSQKGNANLSTESLDRLALYTGVVQRDFLVN